MTDLIDPIIPVAKVVELTGLSRMTIYRLLKAGDFAPPLYLTQRKLAFRQADVQRWLAKRRDRAKAPKGRGK